MTDKTLMPFNPMPFSAAVKSNGVVYCSGNIGMDPKTLKIVKSSVKDRTVSGVEIRPSGGVGRLGTSLLNIILYSY